MLTFRILSFVEPKKILRKIDCCQKVFVFGVYSRQCCSMTDKIRLTEPAKGRSSKLYWFCLKTVLPVWVFNLLLISSQLSDSARYFSVVRSLSIIFILSYSDSHVNIWFLFRLKTHFSCSPGYLLIFIIVTHLFSSVSTAANDSKSVWSSVLLYILDKAIDLSL